MQHGTTVKCAFCSFFLHMYITMHSSKNVKVYRFLLSHTLLLFIFLTLRWTVITCCVTQLLSEDTYDLLFSYLSIEVMHFGLNSRIATSRISAAFPYNSGLVVTPCHWVNGFQRLKYFVSFIFWIAYPSR